MFPKTLFDFAIRKIVKSLIDDCWESTMRYFYCLVSVIALWGCDFDESRILPGNSSGDTSSTPSTTKSFTLHTGADSNCYLYETYDLRCWGSHDYRNFESKNPMSLTMGREFACIIDYLNKLHCESKRSDLNIDPPSTIASKEYLYISAGDSHVCAIDTENKLYCWGDNESGEIDIPSLLQSSTVTKVSSGSKHSCAIETGGRVYCWGNNDQGQSELGSTIRNKIFQEISSGGDHSCGIEAETKRLYCWGSIFVDRTVSTEAMEFVDSGSHHVCAIDTSGDLHCWGSSSLSFSLLPDLSLSKNFKGISAGSQHNCAYTTSNQTICWGDNGDQQLNSGTLP